MSITHVLFGFSGRATRFHFWMGQVAVIALLICLGIAGAMSMASIKTAATPQEVIGAAGVMLLVVLAFLVLVTWIGWAVAVKRLHDRNKSWVWMLITLVPAVMLMWTGMTQGLQALLAFEKSPVFVIIQIGVWLWFLVELGFMKGTPGGNMYGPAPDGTGVFSPDFDELLAGEGYDVAAGKSFDAGAASPAAPAMARSASVVATARQPRTGAVQRQGGFGRRNARA